MIEVEKPSAKGAVTRSLAGLGVELAHLSERHQA